jgi:threonine aldolase
MRQASGILAGAAIYALDHNLGRLAEDHVNARRLAGALASVQGIAVETDPVETNMVYFRVPDVDGFHAACLERGLRFSKQVGNRLRAVTHLDVDAGGIERAIRIVREVAAAGPR